MHPLNDYPIKTADEDLYGFDQIAIRYVDAIKRLDNSDGLVVAITGGWGTGKTSLLNLMTPRFDEDDYSKVITFNPWMFQSSDDLIQRLFAQLRAVLGKDSKYASAARNVDKYADLLEPMNSIPLIGGYSKAIQQGAKAASRVADMRLGDASAQRDKLNEWFSKANVNFYIVIDDIDRLDSSGVLEILRMVRLTASFPKFTYILSYDPKHVARAIDAQRGYRDGRTYLEKIVFAEFAVPSIASEVGLRHLGDAINEVAEDLTLHISDEKQIWNVLRSLLLPLIRNRRNLQRFVASIEPAVVGLSHEIDFLDILVLEAIRLFEPAAFSVIQSNPELLGSSPADIHLFRDTLAKPRELVIQKIEQSLEVLEVEALIKYLFPVAWRSRDQNFNPPSKPSKELAERKVGSRHNLILYLSQFEDEAITARRRAVSLLELGPTKAAYESELRGLSSEEVLNSLEMLMEYAPAIADDGFLPLFETLFKLPFLDSTRQHRFFDPQGAEWVQNAIVANLASRPRDRRFEPVKRLFDSMNDLESQFRVAEISEFSEAPEVPLLLQEEIREIQGGFGEALLSAPTDALVNEPRLGLLFVKFAEWLPDRIGELRGRLKDSSLHHPLLESLLRPAHGMRSDEIVYYVDLELLTKIVGSQETSLDIVRSVSAQEGLSDDLTQAVAGLLERVDRKTTEERDS